MPDITLKKARTIIRKAMDAGKDANMKPLSVVVLDAGGHVIAFERGDGAPPGRFEIAQGKAYGCIMFGVGGTGLNEIVERAPTFMASAASAYGGKLLPVPGGILVRDQKGRVVGAVGVTGDTSENDLAVGLVGIEAAGFTGEG